MTDAAARTLRPASRVHRPELPHGTVSRARLLERLQQDTPRLIVVTGPAGFGKSVLVSDWLRRVEAATAWLSLDELDNDPKRLLNHLADAVQALGGDTAERAAAELRHLRAGADLTREADLADALAAIDPRATLVVDDVHVLEEPGAVQIVAGLVELRRAPRLVLLSRITLPLSLGRLRASGELLEVSEDELRFTNDEAVEFFDLLLPGGLEPPLVERLGNRTEGWAAGLRMAALALERAEDRRAVVDAFAGSHRFVADYLVEEALARQPEALQQFLMETAVLRRFTAESCGSITGIAGAAQLLRQAEAAGLFLVPLGEDREWFRYHHLFAELLRFRLQRLSPRRVDELHEAASSWFEAQDEVPEALEHAAAMSSPNRVALLLDRHALRLLSRSQMASLGRWLRQVPEEVQRQHPTLLLSLGWVRTLAERAPDIEPLLAAARVALDAGPAGYDDAAIRSTRIELDILRAYHARFTGRHRESLQIGSRLLEQLGAGDGALRGRTLFNQGRAHMMLGEMAPAAELLELSLQENIRARTHYLVITGLAHVAAVQLETAGALQARQSLEAAVRMAEESRLTRLPAFSTVLFMLGHVHAVMGELDAAAPCFQKAIALGVMGDMPDGRANGLVGMARLHGVRGELDQAHELLLMAEAMARTQNLGLIDGDVAIPRRRLALHMDAAGRAGALPHGLPPSRREGTAAEWGVVAEAEALCDMVEALRHDTPAGRDAALAAAARIRRESAPRGRYLAACVAQVVESLLDEGQGRWPRLAEALTAAARRQYVLPLLEIGPALAPMLHAALAQPLARPARAFARELLDRMAALPSGAAGETLDTAAESAGVARQQPVALFATALPEVSALTDREMEVLGHLSRGLSNKAIARSMFVSPETVKTHLKHIFDKLNVSRRREAVAIARSLGLIPDTPDA